MSREETRKRLARVERKHSDARTKELEAAALIGELRAKRSQSKASARPRRGTVRHYRRGFDAAKVDHLFPATGGTPRSVNSELIEAGQTLRLRARDEANNNESVARAIQLVDTNVIGPHGIGMRPDFVDDSGNPDTRDNEIVAEAWSEFARRGICDVTGRLSLKDLCSVYIRSVFRDGECLVLPRQGWKHNEFRFALQILDIDYLDDRHNQDLGNGRYVIMGVEVDEWNRAVGYHLRKGNQHENLYRYTSHHDAERLDADQVIHGFMARRPEQIRGYTAIHAAFQSIHQLKGYAQAEVIAARAAAEKMGFIILGESQQTYDGPGSEQSDGSVEIEQGPAEWNVLPHGAEVKNYDPSHPNSVMPDFMKALKREFASGVGMDYNTLANDYEGVNFSSLRQAALEQRAFWRQQQQFVVDSLLTPVYRSWLRMSILSGSLPLPAHKLKKYHKVVWEPRGFEWVDPKKEAEGNLLLYRLGATSLTRILAPQGTNPEEIFRERKKEAELAEKYNVPLDEGVSEVSSPAHDEDDD